MIVNNKTKETHIIYNCVYIYIDQTGTPFLHVQFLCPSPPLRLACTQTSFACPITEVRLFDTSRSDNYEPVTLRTLKANRLRVLNSEKMEKPSWFCTIFTQLFLCFALFLALNLGQRQEPIYGSRSENRGLDLYFISVRGGFRTLKQQTHLLKQVNL